MIASTRSIASNLTMRRLIRSTKLFVWSSFRSSCAPWIRTRSHAFAAIFSRFAFVNASSCAVYFADEIRASLSMNALPSLSFAKDLWAVFCFRCFRALPLCLSLVRFSNLHRHRLTTWVRGWRCASKVFVWCFWVSILFHLQSDPAKAYSFVRSQDRSITSTDSLYWNVGAL